MPFLKTLHQLLGTGAVRLDTERTGGLQETVVAAGIGDLDQGIQLLTRLSGLPVAQEQHRRQLTRGNVVRGEFDPTAHRGQTRLVVLEVQRDPGGTLRRIGVPGEDGGMLIMGL